MNTRELIEQLIKAYEERMNNAGYLMTDEIQAYATLIMARRATV